VPVIFILWFLVMGEREREHYEHKVGPSSLFYTKALISPCVLQFLAIFCPCITTTKSVMTCTNMLLTLKLFEILYEFS
jgi:hypothetical protein